MNDGTHISSLIVHARPDRLDAVRQSILALGGEVPGMDAGGKLVIVIETDTEAGVTEFANGVALLDGVLSANLVFHMIDTDDDPAPANDATGGPQ